MFVFPQIFAPPQPFVSSWLCRLWSHCLVRSEYKNLGAFDNVHKKGKEKYTEINSNELTLHFAQIKCNVVSMPCFAFHCNIFACLLVYSVAVCCCWCCCVFVCFLFFLWHRNKLIWNIFKDLFKMQTEHSIWWNWKFNKQLLCEWGMKN